MSHDTYQACNHFEFGSLLFLPMPVFSFFDQILLRLQKENNAARGRDRSDANLLLAEIQLKYRTRSNRITHVIVNPRGRCLVISPYGTIAPVEGASVIGVHVDDCAEIILIFGDLWGLEWYRPRSLWASWVSRILGICEKWPRSTTQLPPKYPIS